jgi:hypothetical protein
VGGVLGYKKDLDLYKWHRSIGEYLHRAPPLLHVLIWRSCRHRRRAVPLIEKLNQLNQRP